MPTRTRRFILFTLLWLTPFLAMGAEGPDAAAPKAEPAADPKKVDTPVPVHVWGDKVRYVREENLARITGNATVIKKDFRVDADYVEARMNPTTGQFTSIVATGNVRINTIVAIPEGMTKRPALQRREEVRRAHCEKATYDLKTEICVLTGTPKKQPMVWINKDQVQADTIRFETKKDEATFTGRVKLSALIPAREVEPVPGAKPGTPTPPAP